MTPEQRKITRKREGGATVSDRQRRDRPHLTLVPISLKLANAYVAEHHRHSRPVAAGERVVGVREGERLCGVAIIGRPVAQISMTALPPRSAGSAPMAPTTPARCCCVLPGEPSRPSAIANSSPTRCPRRAAPPLRAAGFKLVKTDAGGGRWSDPVARLPTLTRSARSTAGSCRRDPAARHDVGCRPAHARICDEDRGAQANRQRRRGSGSCVRCIANTCA